MLYELPKRPQPVFASQPGTLRDRVKSQTPLVDGERKSRALRLVASRKRAERDDQLRQRYED